MLRRTSFFFALFLFAFVGPFGTSFANYSFSPIVQEFAPVGPNATQLFHLTNPNDEPLALQCTIAARTADENGNELLDESEAEELFFLYPSQFILPPKRQQVIRVSWLGDVDLSKELAFRLLCKQLPIDLRKPQKRKKDELSISETTQIKLLYNYSAALYVVPKGVKPHIILDRAGAVEDEEGNTFLEVVFYNQGKKHQLLKEITLTVSSEESSISPVTIDKDAFQGGVNLLAESKKRYWFPWPETFPKGPVQVAFDFLGKDDMQRK